MELGLQGKVVVITGGGTGIGRSAALEFLREGASVAVLGRRIEPLKQLQKEAEDEGYTLYCQSCDVTDTAALRAFAHRVRETFGSLDIWINNAGVSVDKPFLDFDQNDWDRVISVNLKAVFDGTQIAGAIMRDQGGGVIINASSFCAKIPHANGVLYAAAKAAVSNMTKSTASALAPYGIRVVGYIPGMIVTPISESMISQYKEKFTKDIALKRLGRPEDLAKPIVFLASDAAGYITGVDLEISGGKFTTQDCDMPYRFAQKPAEQ